MKLIKLLDIRTSISILGLFTMFIQPSPHLMIFSKVVDSISLRKYSINRTINRILC